MSLKNKIEKGIGFAIVCASPFFMPSAIQYGNVSQALEKGHSQEFIQKQYEEISKEGNTSEKMLEFTGRPGRALAYKLTKTPKFPWKGYNLLKGISIEDIRKFNEKYANAKIQGGKK